MGTELYSYSLLINMKVTILTIKNITYAAVGCVIALTLLSEASAATYSLASFGAAGNGNIAQATANRNAIVAALSNSSATIEVTAGTYLVDNSTLLPIPGFTGTLIFDSGAQFILTNPNGSGG